MADIAHETAETAYCTSWPAQNVPSKNQCEISPNVPKQRSNASEQTPETPYFLRLARWNVPVLGHNVPRSVSRRLERGTLVLGGM